MRKQPSSNALSTSGAVSQRADKKPQPGGTSTENADKIMDEIRSLGYYPRENGATRALAERRRRAKKAGKFSGVQLEELHKMKTPLTSGAVPQRAEKKHRQQPSGNEASSS